MIGHTDVQGKEPIVAHQTCDRCGIPKSRWKGNNGQGVEKNDQAYCCDGCANNSGCTCGG